MLLSRLCDRPFVNIDYVVNGRTSFVVVHLEAERSLRSIRNC